MPNANTHVLVIDDNADILFILEAMLKHKGYTVTSLTNAKTIEETIQQIEPDIILLDIFLSGTDGREICKQLKTNKQLSKIPILMLSADQNAKITCLEAGADYFLNKPFEMKELLFVVANLVSHN